VQLGRVWLLRGAFSEAEALLARARAELESVGQRVSALEAAILEALARLGAGDAPAALERIDAAAAHAGDSALTLRPVLAHARASALLALGRADEAEREIAAGAISARDQGLPYEEAILVELRSEVARRAGHPPDGAEEARASETLASLGVRKTAPSGTKTSRHADR
jgi:ATP/maltotriose-dependent transcriptional regulator MalT